jgi:hypothetical protein
MTFSMTLYAVSKRAIGRTFTLPEWDSMEPSPGDFSVAQTWNFLMESGDDPVSRQ